MPDCQAVLAAAIVKRGRGSWRRSVFDASTGVIKKGYLDKKGKGLFSWQRRFFSASGHHLRYFTGDDEQDLLATIDLTGVTITCEIKTSKDAASSRSSLINLRAGDKDMKLRAENASEVHISSMSTIIC
jgi:hypothetical protein